MSTYFIVISLALSMPLILSFDRKVHFYTQWKYIFPAILLTMVLFIPWDILFVKRGVWGFNASHISGLNILKIPIEEWLFFIVVPYSSLFTYEVLNKYISRDFLGKWAIGLSSVLILVFLIIAGLNTGKAYTVSSFGLAGFTIFLVQFVIKANYMGRFYLAYLIILIPFLAVNGILTGSFIENEVVWYNDSENLSVKIFTIPIEDAAYGLLLILINTGIYEYLKKGS